MPHRVIDLEAQIRKIKANENFLAFAGFTLRLDDSSAPLDGVIKIAGRLKQGSTSGFLTASLLVDIGENPGQRNKLAKVLSGLDEETLKPRLGKSFEYLVETETGVEESAIWFMKDITFFYKELESRTQYYVTARILPAMAAAIPIVFDEVQWWDDKPDICPECRTKEQAESRLDGFLSSVSGFLRKRLG